MKLRDLTSGNKYKSDIAEAIAKQAEASFYITPDKSNAHRLEFLKRVKKIYNNDAVKFNRFNDAFLGEVVPSVDVCDTIYSQVYRVWDSQDMAREYLFSNSDLNAEAVAYLDKFVKFWHHEYWEAYKHQFNSFIVVDLPVAQTTERPEPYPFILDVSRVLYIERDIDNKPTEIIFESIEEGKKFWYYYTDTFYSKYLIDGEEEIRIFEFPHNLKRCPVHKIWNELQNTKSWLLNRSLILPEFEDLFWYIYKTIESRKADLMYLNPIKQLPRLSCGFESEKSKSNHYNNYGSHVKCNGGYLYNVTDKTVFIDESGQQVLCPICGSKRHSSEGAGNTISVDIDTQAVKDGKVDPAQPLVHFITPDIEGIEVQYQRIKEAGELIVKRTVGSDDQPTKSALNELQQTAIFESKENVLNRISEGISKVITDVERDILELRYRNSFKSNRYHQGTKFYLHTVDELLERREKAKNPVQKRQIDEQIIDVKYRNNQKKRSEERLLYKLLPYSTISDEEFTDMITSGILKDDTDISLRYQFSDAVEKFESRYGSIIEFFQNFSENIPEHQRVESIRLLLTQNIKILNYAVQNQVSTKNGN